MTPEETKFVTDIITIGTQAILAVVGIWYTFETRRLRTLAGQQLDALQKGGRLSISPYLVVGVIPLAKLIEGHCEQISDVDSAKLKAQFTEATAKDLFLFTCVVINVSKNIACYVNAYVYDFRTKSYLESDIGTEVVEPDKKTILPVSKPYIDQAGLKQVLQKNYAESADVIAKHLSPTLVRPEHSALFVVFRDIEGSPFCIRREFKFDDDGDPMFGPSSFTALRR